MKIFISWSGEVSHNVACVLRDWLPYLLQAVKPFVSDRDIAKGTRWSDVLAEALKDTDFGIICITPYNLYHPWLNFESGALSKAIDRSAVIPFLFRVERKHLQGPLAQFQSTVYEKEDFLNLLSAINNKLDSEDRLDQERLAKTFDQWWPLISDALNKVPDGDESETETCYKWLCTPGDLVRRELDAGCKSIWVVTPSPYHDLQLTCVQNVVQSNMTRGVRYTFIMPASEDAEAAEETLRNIFRDRPGQLQVKKIPREIFQSLAVTHYIILNPEYGEDYKPRVLLELPISERDYWIEVESEAAFGFATRFHKLVEETHNSTLNRTDTALSRGPAG